MCAIHGTGDPDDPFIDPHDHAQLAAVTALVQGARGASGDATGIPVLNSLPGAPTAIYLDFNAEGTRAGYSIDGEPATMNAAEQTAITVAWQRVSSYFAMFNTNVTTVKPSVPFAWQLTTPDEGGWSYVGVFPNSATGAPQSFNNSDSVTARTSAYAHELGHNFGLWHQGEFDALGNKTEEYTDGTDAQHGAIMGIDYSRTLRKWFYGHDSHNGAATLQDDLAVIAGRIDNFGGDGYRPDDYGGTAAAATPLAVSGSLQKAAGVIERRADVDAFGFTSAGGRYLLSASRVLESAVDLKMEVYDAGGKLIAADDPAGGNDADVALDLPAGTYTISIAGHGNYGDLGMYAVQVSPIAGGFDSADVSLVRRAGTTAYDPAAGAWTLTAGGTSLTAAADEFRYAYQTLRGDGSITARVTSVGATGASSKGGIMLRESLAAGARHATVDLLPAGTVQFIRRTTANATSTLSTTTASTIPYFLRLTRSGTSITAERSATGLINSWLTVGTTTISGLAASVYVGLIACSVDAQNSTTATFDNVSVTGTTGDAPIAANALAAPATLSVSLGAGSGLNAAWDAVAGATGYLLERSLDGVSYATAATTTALSFADNGLAGSYRYFYRVRATDTAGASPASIVVNAINRPSAVTNLVTMSVSQTKIAIDWTDTLGESGYRVERSADGGATWSILSSTVPLNAPSYIDAAATVGKVYTYRVTPLSALGDGVTSTTITEQARLLIVGGLAATNVTSGAVTLTWNDLNSIETGYKLERSSDKATWTTLNAALGPDVTGYTDTGLSSVSKYYYRVQGITALTESAYAAPLLVATPATNPLPAPWQTANIGDTPARASAAGQLGGTYTIVNAGSDIGTTADDLTFVYQPLVGDAEVIARVASMDDDVTGAEVGLMFRSGLADNAPYAMAIITNDADSRLNRRSTAGGSTSSTNGPNTAAGLDVTAPYWLRLGRVGDLITAAQSPDGVTWATIGTATVALGSTIYVGLGLSSHDVTEMTRAQFTNVSVVGTPPDTTPPAAPAFGAITTDTGVSASDRVTGDNTLLMSGTAEPGSTVTVTRVGVGVIGTAVAAAGTGSWTLDYTTVALPDGTHAFTATARDVAGNVGPAGAMSVTVDRVAPAVAAARFDREVAQAFTVGLSEPVAVPLTDGNFQIVQVGGAGTTYGVTVSVFVAATNTYTLRVANGTVLGNGQYELRVVPGTAGDVAGNPLAAGTASAFRVLAGDANDDGVVGFDDLLVLAQNYGQVGRTYSQGNFSYDAAGEVGFDDLLILAQNYGGASLAGDYALAQSMAAPKPTAAAKRRPAGNAASIFGSRGIA